MAAKPFLISALTLVWAASSPAADWPMWRGPNSNGTAIAEEGLPRDFSDKSALKWSVDIPGRSHGSACVVAENVFIAVADEEKQTQSIYCFDRETGDKKWNTEIHEGGFTQQGNKKASWASGTPACDGENVYINFLNGDAVYTTALDLDGEQVWQTKITDYVLHQGYGSSPMLYEDLLLVSADNKGGGAICGLDRKTGEIVWRHERAEFPNYPSPVVLEASGKKQLFMIGTEKVTSLDPLTGEVNWEIDGSTTECVSTTVTDGKHIYSSGGYPTNHITAIVADGSGDIAWEKKDRLYVPSLLEKDGYIWAALDSGIAVCWDAATGEEMWKDRLGGNFTGSPTLVTDAFYVVNETGEVFIVETNPEGPEILGPEKIADETFSTPSICGNEIFLRVADYDGEQRQERLVCYSGK